MSSSARAVPFFCPFCGEEELRPWGDDPDRGHGDWRCEACLRVFSLRFNGSTGRGDAAVDSAVSTLDRRSVAPHERSDR